MAGHLSSSSGDGKADGLSSLFTTRRKPLTFHLSVRYSNFAFPAMPSSGATIVVAAQQAAKDTNHVAYVYEPARDAVDGAWDALVPRFVQDGLANLETLEPGMIITLSKLTVDAKGNPAPVTDVCTDPEKAYDAVMDAYTLARCR